MKQQRTFSPDLFYDIFQSPVGALYLLFTGKTLTGISFIKPDINVRRGNAPALIKKELTEYFKNGRDSFTQGIAFTRGTEFEQKVWFALKDIPFGETRSYKWLAGKAGRPNACRAAGRALGRNPVPIVFPCHRVIEADGSIGGYSAGIDIKRRLLDIEYYIKLNLGGSHE
jgi:methylated-DNA-[protein]-cysteine S-methyltransferase